MAVLTKEHQRQADMNNYYPDFAKSRKNGYYKYDVPLLQKHRNPELRYNKKQFKDDTFKCFNKNQSIPKKDPRINNFENLNSDKVPLMKYDKKINTSYTPITLFVHILIILQHVYTLYATPIVSWRLSSFTQLVYLTTTCFHIATFLANILKKIQWERAFVLYGTWVIWIGWAMCLWLIHPENRPDSHLFRAIITSGAGDIIGPYYYNDSITIMQDLDYNLEYLLAPMDIAPFLMNGKWSTTTLPIISFFLLLVIRRNHWGLITWEHLTLLDYSRTLKWYRTWCVAGAGAGWMLTWEAVKFWFGIPLTQDGIVLYRTDLPTFPGLFNVLCASVVAGTFMACWWSFWTFQYRGIIWKKEFKEGVVVWSSTDGGWMCGDISC